ncbi:hypothetical protein F383_29386 [Gossypium arboreum]|uniref:Uncharacterized protein n=1 Tax=Gossypium arboreum TaxID=29729 RepID=A0A0B0PJ81_GOSAR|nr:hypothetical protein F383_29386 [Gossypium arboreum]
MLKPLSCITSVKQASKSPSLLLQQSLLNHFHRQHQNNVKFNKINYNTRKIREREKGEKREIWPKKF